MEYQYLHKIPSEVLLITMNMFQLCFSLLGADIAKNFTQNSKPLPNLWITTVLKISNSLTQMLLKNLSQPLNSVSKDIQLLNFSSTVKQSIMLDQENQLVFLTGLRKRPNHLPLKLLIKNHQIKLKKITMLLLSFSVKKIPKNSVSGLWLLKISTILSSSTSLTVHYGLPLELKKTPLFYSNNLMKVEMISLVNSLLKL